MAPTAGQIAVLRAQLALKANDPPTPPPPPVSPEAAGLVPFAFDSGVIIFGWLAAGERVTCVQIEITEAFDDPSAAALFGTSADPGLILSAPTRRGQYGTDEQVTLAAPDLLQLSVRPGSSTRGAGVIFYRILR